MPTLDEFVAMIRSSGLIPATALQGALGEFDRQYVGDSENRVHEFILFMVQRGLLTQWQCQKLSIGRTKGYFLGPFTLLEELHASPAGTRYRAVNTETGERVELLVAQRTWRAFRQQ